MKEKRPIEEIRKEREEKRQALLQESEEKARLSEYKKKRSNCCWNWIMMISSTVFVICIIELGWYYYKGAQYKKDMDKIEELVVGGSIAGNGVIEFDPNNGDVLIFPDEEEYVVSAGIRKYKNVISDRWKESYQYLSEANPDCFGFIEIPDTVIKFPVMFTPDRYDYYCWKNFSGTYETRGTPFMDAATRLGESQNYIIYAHNMYDGSAFGTLPKYLDESYYEKHKYIYFNTAMSEGIYEVMAVCQSQLYNQNENVFKYYKYGGKLNQQQFSTFVTEVKNMAKYDTGITADWGDELITLSTCYHIKENDNGRLFVVAKRIK